MGLTRASSGLLLRDEFSSDTEADYTRDGNDVWSVSGGYMTSSGGNVSSVLRRADISTAKCVTARVLELATTDNYVGTVAIFGATSGDAGYSLLPMAHLANGYANIYEDNVTSLASGLGVTRANPYHYFWRLYISAGVVYAKNGYTALDVLALSVNDPTYTQGYPGMRNYGAASWDWLEARTSVLITCTGMTDGHYLRVTDGTTAAEAVASGGTASVDAGAVLFPLTSVAIYTEAAGAGTKIAEILAAALADMGGGDAFAYEGVGKTLEADWALRAAIGNAAAEIWNVRAAIGAQASAIWAARAAVGAAIASPWDTRAAVAAENALEWAARVVVGAGAELDWNLRTPAGADTELVWAARSTAAAELLALWDVLATVFSAVGHDLVLEWQVRRDVAALLGLMSQRQRRGLESTLNVRGLKSTRK
jgi:hypothetical protein